MGTSPGDVSCRINKSGIKLVNPDDWPLSPASPLCEQTWPKGFFLAASRETEQRKKWAEEGVPGIQLQLLQREECIWGEGH